VLRTSDHYDRAEVDNLPDLVMQWNTRNPITTAWSPKAGLVYQPYEGWRTGDHRPGGLLLARTPSVVRGTTLPPVSIVDLGPTICALLGVELAEADGRPMPELSSVGQFWRHFS
jgi:predicted AlkP superfamily phosphohydrolase/phosphomutase